MKAFLLFLCSCFLAAGAAAQDFPSKSIRLVIPLAPGGSTDFISRLVAQQMAPVLGQSILADNRPGGGGLPGFIGLLRATPDGHTIMGAEAGQWAIVPAMRSDLPYNPAQGFRTDRPGAPGVPSPG